MWFLSDDFRELRIPASLLPPGGLDEFHQDTSIASIRLKNGETYRILIVYPDEILGIEGQTNIPFDPSDIDTISQTKEDETPSRPIQTTWLGLHCPNCSAVNSITQMLATTEFSWPDGQMIYPKCKKCGHNFHVLVENARISSVKWSGSSDWKILETSDAKSLSLRIDPAFLQCWYRGRHFEVPARV